MRFFLILFLSSLILFAAPALALEYLQFNDHGNERNEEGRIILESPEAFAFESREGKLHVIDWDNVLTRNSDDVPFTSYSKEEMIERLQKEFPPNEGYHYLDMYGPFILVYTTSRAFANWYGGLLEKMHEQYVSYWKRLGVKLTEPKFQMVVLVFSNDERFRAYAAEEGVSLLKEQCAYYHKLTNRIALYDMSERQSRQEGNQRRATAADIQRFLNQPGAFNNITTVIHEAVHQVGYNTGMHPKYAPIPVWVCEGLAIFHEVPDPKRRPGWTIGPHINRYRLEHLRKFFMKPQSDPPIQRMLRDDDLFQQSSTALDNYALAWGLTYYLVRKHPKEWAAYLQILQTKTSVSEETADLRLKEFESCFGNDWETFYKDFYAFLRRL